MKSSFTRRDVGERGANLQSEPGSRTATKSAVVINWVLALATLAGAAAVVLFAYVKVLGTAACSDQTCPRLGPGEFGFTVITYGAPVLAVLTVVLSFFTARRARGVVLPLITWLLLLIAAAALVVTFP